MSFFSTEKKMNLAIMGLHSNGIQTIGSSYEDVNIFIPSQSPATTQIASSIKYPTISTNSSPSTITLEMGYKYLIEVRLKLTDSTPSLAENCTFIATDISNAQLSSAGSLAVYREGAISSIQEKCVFYFDASSTSLIFKIRALKSGSGGGLNVNGDAGADNFKCHILIKAWR